MGSDGDIVADAGVSLIVVFAGSTKGHPVKHDAVFADFAGRADHHSHAVVAKKALVDAGARMYLHTGKKPADLGEEPGQKAQPQLVERMANQTVHGDGMQ
jgi:hypothetical protein